MLQELYQLFDFYTTSGRKKSEFFFDPQSRYGTPVPGTDHTEEDAARAGAVRTASSRFFVLLLFHSEQLKRERVGNSIVILIQDLLKDLLFGIRGG